RAGRPVGRGGGAGGGAARLPDLLPRGRLDRAAAAGDRGPPRDAAGARPRLRRLRRLDPARPRLLRAHALRGGLPGRVPLRGRQGARPGSRLVVLRRDRPPRLPGGAPAGQPGRPRRARALVRLPGRPPRPRPHRRVLDRGAGRGARPPLARAGRGGVPVPGQRGGGGGPGAAPVTERLSDMQGALFDDRRSALARYRDLFVGEPGVWPLLRYEAVLLLASWVPGALGLLLRRWLYPRLLGACGRNVSFGVNVTLRHPRK